MVVRRECGEHNSRHCQSSRAGTVGVIGKMLTESPGQRRLVLFMRPFPFGACPRLGCRIRIQTMAGMMPVATMSAMTKDMHQRTGQQQKKGRQPDKMGTVPEYKINGDNRNCGQQDRTFDVLKAAEHIRSPMRRWTGPWPGRMPFDDRFGSAG